MTMKDGAQSEPAELIAAARAGDRGAFGHLYARYARMVHGIALMRLRQQDADDVVQEVFVRALEQLRTLRDLQAFGGWLTAITRHVIVDTSRRTRRTVELEDEPQMREAQHDELEARR